MMKTPLIKTICQRSILGIPIGIAIGYILTIVYSLPYGNGQYYPVSPGLLAWSGRPICGVLIQLGLFILIGAISAGASVIWEIGNWSLLRQSATYFAILAFTLIGCGWAAGWFYPSLSGLLLYLVLFTLIFILIWIIRYWMIRRSIRSMNKEINASLKQKKDER